MFDVPSELLPITLREYGNRHHPSVAVLHGGPGAPGSVATLAEALSGQFHVLEPLQRRGSEIPLSVERHVEDIAAVLSERMAIVGWSWGAMLALSFAFAHPDLVESLVLIGCGTYDETARALYQQRMRQCLGKDGLAQQARLEEQLGAADNDEERDRLMGERGRLAMEAQSVDLIGPNSTDQPPDARGMKETWHDVLRLQSEGIEPAAFVAIKVPVLMIHGEEDPHSGTAIRDSLLPFIPQLEFVGIANCGHLPWLERQGRQQCLSLLADWLRQPRSASR
jgi:pimeloyl-ACP methyl ester carboxylesterase